MKDSAFRGGAPSTDRTRSTFVFGNVFLHLHAVRTHRWSLRWSTTWGLGIAAMAAFLVTLATGVLLMFYYKPHPLAAYDSIKDIHFVVPTGRFIRNIHRWAANAMVVVVLLHMARVFFTAAYRQRREFNWLIGMALLATTLGLSFTGYLLPWDQLAYWAITIGANIAQSPREVTDALNITDRFDPGGFQKLLLLGSDTVGEEALIRFYVLHVMLLPLVLAALAAVHFWRIRKDGGLARPADADARVGAPGVDSLPVFTDSPRKTYQLAALVRGKTAAVGRSPEATVPSMPHLFYAELGGPHADGRRLPRARDPLGRAAQGAREPGRAREPGEGAVVLPRPAGARLVLGVHGRDRDPGDRPPRPRPHPVPRPRDAGDRRVVRRAGRKEARRSRRRASASSRRSRSRRSRSASGGSASGSRTSRSSS